MTGTGSFSNNTRLRARSTRPSAATSSAAESEEVMAVDMISDQYLLSEGTMNMENDDTDVPHTADNIATDNHGSTDIAQQNLGENSAMTQNISTDQTSEPPISNDTYIDDDQDLKYIDVKYPAGTRRIVGITVLFVLITIFAIVGWARQSSMSPSELKALRDKEADEALAEMKKEDKERLAKAKNPCFYFRIWCLTYAGCWGLFCAAQEISTYGCWGWCGNCKLWCCDCCYKTGCCCVENPVCKCCENGLGCCCTSYPCCCCDSIHYTAGLCYQNLTYAWFIHYLAKVTTWSSLCDHDICADCCWYMFCNQTLLPWYSYSNAADSQSHPAIPIMKQKSLKAENEFLETMSSIMEPIIERRISEERENWKGEAYTILSQNNVSTDIINQIVGTSSEQSSANAEATENTPTEAAEEAIKEEYEDVPEYIRVAAVNEVVRETAVQKHDATTTNFLQIEETALISTAQKLRFEINEIDEYFEKYGDVLPYRPDIQWYGEDGGKACRQFGNDSSCCCGCNAESECCGKKRCLCCDDPNSCFYGGSGYYNQSCCQNWNAAVWTDVVCTPIICPCWLAPCLRVSQYIEGFEILISGIAVGVVTESLVRSQDLEGDELERIESKEQLAKGRRWNVKREEAMKEMEIEAAVDRKLKEQKIRVEKKEQELAKEEEK